MFAIRQIIEDPQEAIPIPQEMRHRRMEVTHRPRPGARTRYIDPIAYRRHQPV